ncbi:MAG TPA: T9SS type A sorting domain-containing protein [Chitinophaga sp.]|uniref:Ig-like domain-containing protein n=1 Tax=Chitinophaga sp. TaxID=1869181 RepID=UPI002B858404|nr:T9SS type A sorting domain-containing protein [Chitinophaga sp.]HVI46027.1 T9SS type A sorting domain-containing protein [Chitinophaga sp.]
MLTQFYSLKKMVWLIAAILCLLCNPLYAQRIYTDSQTNGVTGICLLCGVVNPGNAVNNANLNDYSSFAITAGLLGVTVYQTLIFSSASISGCDSLVIGIGSGNAVLSANLFGNITVQTFNGSTANNDAHAVDSSVLRLLQNNTRAEVVLHPTQSFDRVKITLNSSLLALLNGFRIYYAYRNSGKPANPVYTVPQQRVCGSVLIPVLNHPEGINYNVRVVYTGLAAAFDTSYTLINSNTITVPAFISYNGAQADIYVQAVNPFTGCKSDNVHQAFITGGYAEYPSVDADSVTICKYDSTTLHAFSPISFAPQMRWYDAPTGGHLVFTGNYYKVSPDTTTTYYVTAGYTCDYPRRRPVRVIVHKLPDPVYSVPQGYVCGAQALTIQNHQQGLNYNVRMVLSYNNNNEILLDTSYIVINSSTIVTPDHVSQGTAYADIYVQSVNPLTGCRSDRVHMTFTQGGSANLPNVDADSVGICRGDSTTLHAYSTLGTIITILWYDAPTGGTLLHTGNYYTVSPHTTTAYYVTSKIGCEYRQRAKVSVVVALCPNSTAIARKTTNRQSNVQPLQLFPNPTSGEVKISSKRELSGALLIIVDLQGKEIKRTILNRNTFRLEAINGMYLIKVVTSDGKIYQSRIMLQK